MYAHVCIYFFTSLLLVSNLRLPASIASAASTVHHHHHPPCARTLRNPSPTLGHLFRKTPPPKLGHCLHGWGATGVARAWPHGVAPLDRARVPMRGGHRRTRAPRQPECCRQSAADHSSLPFAEHASKRRRASAAPQLPRSRDFPRVTVASH